MKLTTKTNESRTALRRKEKILTSAMELFWRKGYLGTSMNEIAKAADMNKATVYYYFKNKVSILYEIATNSMQGFACSARPILDSDLSPIEKLEKLIDVHIKWELSNIARAAGHLERRNLPPRLSRKYIALRDSYEGEIRKIVEACLNEGKGRDINPKLASLLTLGLLTSIIQWYKPTGDLSTADITAEACSFVLNALGIKHIEE